MLSPPKPLDKIQPNLICELLAWMGRATSVCLLCYLRLNHWTKFNQILMCELHEWGMQCHTFLAPPPGGQKVKYHVISITKSFSEICLPNFVCVLTNIRYKTYQKGLSFCRLGHAPGVGLWGTGGSQGVENYFFPNMVMWHIKLTGMTSRTECK